MSRLNVDKNSANRADVSTKVPADLVEETLKEIRLRKSSETMSANVGVGDVRRLTCEEIDQVLNQIRSRSQSLSGRPPPPKSSPPPLPKEEFNAGKTPFGTTRSSPPSRRPQHQQQQQQQNQSRPRVGPCAVAAAGRSNPVPTIGRRLTEEEISDIIDSHRRKKEQEDLEKAKQSSEQRNIEPKMKDRAESRASKEPESAFENLEGGVWHHNPTYDAPKDTKLTTDAKVTPTSDAAKVCVEANADVGDKFSAFETVRELNERIQSMSEDLDRVRARADQINEDLQREIGNDSDYENCRKPEKESARSTDKPKPENNFFRKINVTLSSGTKDEKPKNFSRQNSAPDSSRKIPISKLDAPFSKPELFGGDPPIPTPRKKVGVKIRSRSAKPTVEPTETNRVVITELSSSDDDDVSSDEDEANVYRATVQTSHRPTVRQNVDDLVRRKNTENDVSSSRRQRVPLRNVGRPESLYIDATENPEVDLGGNFR